MKVYLWKKNGEVYHYAAIDENEAQRIAGNLGGFTTPPAKSCTIEEWEAAGSVAHINGSGKIILGEKPETVAKRDEINTLEAEEAQLQAELDGKDYKVIKAAEVGNVLAETDPPLHARRDWCRNRINEIRDRLAELTEAA